VIGAQGIVPERRNLNFEVGGSVILVGKDLQFVGMSNTGRIRFVISNAALQRLSGSVAELTQQQTFKVYDRYRQLFQSTARRLYERASNEVKTIKIAATDL
jgi:hypothetical protein